MSNYKTPEERWPTKRQSVIRMPKSSTIEAFLVLVMLGLVATVLVKVATFFMQGNIPGVFAGALSIAWAWTCILAARLVKVGGGAA